MPKAQNKFDLPGVYKLNCSDCNKFYIDVYKRQLPLCRLAYHKNQFKGYLPSRSTETHNEKQIWKFSRGKIEKI